MKLFRRSRIFLAPASVKVIANIFSAEISVLAKMLAIRAERSCVFPVPGPAITSTGPSILSTAFFCSVFNIL